MIKQIEILDAINEALVMLYKDLTVYRDACPKDFERPSFFIRAEQTKTEQVNFCTVSVEQSITIQCIDDVDEHYEASTDRLTAITDAVMEIFAKGFVPVADRCLNVKAYSCVRELDVADVRVTLSWFDDRPTVTTDLPTVKTVETNLKNNSVQP